MFNKNVLNQKNRNAVLKLLTLTEKHDKFNNTHTRYRLSIVDEIDLLKLKQGWTSTEVVNVMFSQEKADKSSIFTLWEVISDTTSSDVLNKAILVSKVQFLIDGLVESHEFSNSRVVGNTKGLMLNEQLVGKLTTAKTLEIRIKTTDGAIDYDEKTCKKFQQYLKEFVEMTSDLDEYDLIQEAEKINPTKKDANVDQKKSKLGSLIKWVMIFTVVGAVINAVTSNSDDKKPVPNTPASQPVEIPKQESQQDKTITDEVVKEKIENVDSK